MSGDVSQSVASRSLGDIAASLPGATAVFRRHKLDFCCGGSESLAQAARHKKIDLAPIEAGACLAIAAAEYRAGRRRRLDRSIVERYHRGASARDAGIALRRANASRRCTRSNPLAPKGLLTSADAHAWRDGNDMQKEEQILFPMMRSGGNR